MSAPGTQMVPANSVGGSVQRTGELEATARLLQKKWGSALSLPVEDLAKVVKITEDSGMNPFFHMDVLGDKLYDNADFWREVLAADPRVTSFEQKRIHFGSEEWEEFIGVEEEGIIAAAVLTTVEMDGKVIPIREANYVTVDDPILGEWGEPEWYDKDHEAEARDYAASLEREGKQVNFFSTKVGFGVKVKLKKPDWVALALKKARSTSARRAGRVAVPRTHAKVLLAVDRIQAMAESHEGLGPEGAVMAPDDPYSTPAKVGRQIRGPSIITEGQRKMLFGLAGKRNMDSFELKKLIGRSLDGTLQGLDAGQIRSVLKTTTDEDVGEIHTSELTLEDFGRIVDVLESLPEEPAGDGAVRGSMLDEDKVQDAEVIQ